MKERESRRGRKGEGEGEKQKVRKNALRDRKMEKSPPQYTWTTAKEVEGRNLYTHRGGINITVATILRLSPSKKNHYDPYYPFRSSFHSIKPTFLPSAPLSSILCMAA